MDFVEHPENRTTRIALFHFGLMMIMSCLDGFSLRPGNSWVSPEEALAVCCCSICFSFLFVEFPHDISFCKSITRSWHGSIINPKKKKERKKVIWRLDLWIIIGNEIRIFIVTSTFLAWATRLQSRKQC